MSSQKKHGLFYSLWKLTISIRLTITLLLLLSIVCIIGTVVPQNAPDSTYRSLYQDSTYVLLKNTGCTDLYHAWWFLALMGVFSINLTACTVHRIPRTRRHLARPDIMISEERAREMLCCKKFSFNSCSPEKEKQFKAALGKHLGKTSTAATGSQTAFFTEKGRLSPLAFYLTHAGILIIIIGVLIGTLGYKGYMQLHEGETKDRVMLRDARGSIAIPFAIRCDKFEVEFYENNMPKDYKSELTVIENGREVLSKTIEVNDPLFYRGIRFYQSSYGTGSNTNAEVLIRIDPTNGKPGNSYRVKVGDTFSIKGSGDRARIDRLIPDFSIDDKGHFFSKSDQPNNPALLITVLPENGEAHSLWSFAKFPDFHKKAGQKYDFHFVNLFPAYFTGLQVTKDPGVLTVWVGCLIMTIGIYLAFFTSHRRIWLVLNKKEDRIQAFVAGTANKNREAFSESFNELFDKLQTTGKSKC